ncbi:MAG: hypothetical protein LBG75_02880 [Candidatus Nomurabacteria bacterium]|jgi:hypothetical protein|nr:hypothetical protein [Candidatus Nomurabacteria bacterium]
MFKFNGEDAEAIQTALEGYLYMTDLDCAIKVEYRRTGSQPVENEGWRFCYRKNVGGGLYLHVGVICNKDTHKGMAVINTINNWFIDVGGHKAAPTVPSPRFRSDTLCMSDRRAAAAAASM